MSNPFYYQGPVTLNQFFNRKAEIRRIVGRINNYGQSSAISGEPLMGKTSLLRHISSPEIYKQFYNENTHFFFSFIDCQILPNPFTQDRFWKKAISPLKERLFDKDPDSEVANSYKVCEENSFEVFVLERLLSQMEKNNLRLVLLLDEFDKLIQLIESNLNAFLGGLRSLASRGRSLSLVIASRKTLVQLSKETSRINYGSPYFNFINDIQFGCFSDEDSNLLLDTGKDRFKERDCKFIKKIAGGYPFLLQVAASELWDLYDDQKIDDVSRLKLLWRRIYEKVHIVFSDMWNSWTHHMRLAMFIVFLAQATKQITMNLHIQSLMKVLYELKYEINYLKGKGFISEDLRNQSGWCIRSEALVYWLTIELRQNFYDKTVADRYIQFHGWNDFISDKQKNELINFVQSTVNNFDEILWQLINQWITE